METIVVIFILVIAAIIVCFEAHIREVDADNAEKGIKIEQLEKEKRRLTNQCGKQKMENKTLSGTIVRMKQEKEKLIGINGFLENQVEALRKQPLKFETFCVKPIEFERTVDIDNGYFELFNSREAEDVIIREVAKEFATTIMNDYNNYKVEKAISFMGNSTKFNFKIRIYPYNHNINYREEGFFSPRKF